MSHDQNFKNLILDYPLASLEFFAWEEAENIPPSAKITPVRQEQLQAQLGKHFRELDTPLLVESPEGEREAVLFIMEEETTARHFSIYRLAHYCLDLAELLDMERVVPVVIFLRPGDYPRSLHLGTARKTYLGFEFLTADLGTIPAMEYVDSRNIVARINLPNMRHDPEQRVEICLRAQEGLAELEPDPNRRIKYIDFILQYANLNESEQAQYEQRLQQSFYREAIMGPVQQAIENSLQQGREEGMQQGMQQGKQEKAVEMAKAALDEGMEIGIVSRISGLPEEEIRKLLMH